VIHRHRFGFRDTCLELVTDLVELHDFWVRYTAGFPAAGEPRARYEALAEGGARFSGSNGLVRSADRSEDLFPMLEGEFLDDLLRWAGPGESIVHAAGIAGDSGAAIYLGAAGAGKSTLSVELVREGGVFLGDDTVIVGNDFAMALPRPICFTRHEQPADLLPEGDDLFDSFGYDYTDRLGRWREALHFLPRGPQLARAGDRFALGEVFLLEREAEGPPARRRLSGAELRARLALARIRSDP
jgi:hypothetical protein